MKFKVIGITGIPLINKGDLLGEFILDAISDMGMEINDDDILVIAETAIAKSEGHIFKLKDLKPSFEAIKLAEKTGKDPEVVEAILQESDEVMKVGPNFIISQN